MSSDLPSVDQTNDDRVIGSAHNAVRFDGLPLRDQRIEEAMVASPYPQIVDYDSEVSQEDRVIGSCNICMEYATASQCLDLTSSDSNNITSNSSTSLGVITLTAEKRRLMCESIDAPRNFRYNKTYFVYPVYDTPREIEIDKNRYLPGILHSRCMIEHGKSSEPNVKYIEGEYCGDTADLVSECSCYRCKILRGDIRPIYKAGEDIFVRVFSIKRTLYMGQMPNYSNEQRRIMSSYLRRLPPSMIEVLTVVEESSFDVTYEIIKNKILYIVQDKAYNPVETRIPQTYVAEFFNNRSRYRVGSPSIIHSNKGSDYDWIVWKDVDSGIKSTLSNHLADESFMKKILIEANYCLITSHSISCCMCNLCKELSCSPTDRTFEDYPLIRVARNFNIVDHELGIVDHDTYLQNTDYYLHRCLPLETPRPLSSPTAMSPVPIQFPSPLSYPSLTDYFINDSNMWITPPISLTSQQSENSSFMILSEDSPITSLHSTIIDVSNTDSEPDSFSREPQLKKARVEADKSHNDAHDSCSHFVGISEVVYDSDGEEMPSLEEVMVVRYRNIEDIDLSAPLPSIPHEVNDDILLRGSTFQQPLPGPHTVVVNSVTRQPYRAQRVQYKQFGDLEGWRFRCVFRDRIVFVAGDLCVDTILPRSSCSCHICRALRHPHSPFYNSTGFEYNGAIYVSVNVTERANPSVFEPRIDFPSLPISLRYEYALVEPGIIELANKCADPISNNGHSTSRSRGPRIIISDSGATKSMFSDRSVFTNYRKLTGVSVRMAGGALTPVFGIGDVGKLKNVLHVPNLVFDLVSESSLALQGMKGEFADNWKTIRLSDGTLFLAAYLNAQGLYVVNPNYLGLPSSDHNYVCFEALTTKAEAIDLLHRTWGHISFDRLQSGVTSGHIPWSHDSLPVNFRKHSSPCVVCSMSKSKRRSFSGPLRPVTIPASHWYMDVWGPAETPALITQNRYMVGFIDAATKHL